MTARLEPDYFRELYRLDDDPWNFETSDYEHGKYARSLAALDGRRFERVLYYFGRDLLLEMLVNLEAALRPGGSLLAVHWRPRTETYPLQGDEVHALLRSELGLEHAVAEAHELYQIDRFDRAA